MGRPRETLEQMVARLNAGAYIPNVDPEPPNAPRGEKVSSTMPKAIAKNYEIKSGREAQAKYDWDGWLNGSKLLLTKGEDYTPDTDTFTGTIKSKAARRGQTVTVKALKAGDPDPCDPKGKAVLPEGFDGIAMQATSEPNAEKAAAYKAHQDKLQADRDARKAAEEASSTQTEPTFPEIVESPVDVAG